MDIIYIDTLPAFILRFQVDLTGIQQLTMMKWRSITMNEQQIRKMMNQMTEKELPRFVYKHHYVYTFIVPQWFIYCRLNYSVILYVISYVLHKTARKKSKRAKRAAKKAEEEFLYKVTDLPPSYFW